MTLQLDNLRYLFVLIAATSFAIICPLASSSFAQAVPCKATLSALPAAAELKGFRLGMTTDQVREVAPQLVLGRTDEFGSSKTTINPGYDPRDDRSSFQDVRSISLDFLDGRLTSLWIGYDKNFKWTTVDEFVNGISRALALPNAWIPWKVRGKTMACADFQVTVSLIAASPSLRILDSRAEEVLIARRIEKEEQETEAADVEAEAIEILGDIKSKTYFTHDCRPSDDISQSNRVIFKGIGEAEKAGYKRATKCAQNNVTEKP